jgi:hypothetical protein
MKQLVYHYILKAWNYLFKRQREFTTSSSSCELPILSVKVPNLHTNPLKNLTKSHNGYP